MSTSTLGMEVCVETRLYHHVENRDGAAVSDQEDITIPTQVDAPELAITSCYILPVHDGRDPWIRRSIYWSMIEKEFA